MKGILSKDARLSMRKLFFFLKRKGDFSSFLEFVRY